MAKSGKAPRAELDAALRRFADLFRAWGREGGKKGAKARWGHLTPEQRSAAARAAAKARWSKKGRKNAATPR